MLPGLLVICVKSQNTQYKSNKLIKYLNQVVN